MNIDSIIFIAYDHYLHNTSEGKASEELFRHYGSNELRLVGKQLDQFISSATTGKHHLLDAVELDRFCTWYYINYVLEAPLLPAVKKYTEKSLIGLQHPTSNCATMIKDKNGSIAGIIQFRPSSKGYHEAIENCIQVFQSAASVTILNARRTKDGREMLIFLLSEQEEGKARTEIYFAESAPCY